MSEGHAFLAPSDAGAWVHCTARPGMAVAYPELGDPDNESAREGDAFHWVLASMLNGNPFPLGGTHNGVVCDSDMEAYAQPWVTYIQSHMAASAQIFVEHKLNMPNISAQCWGTPDAVITNPDTKIVHIFDTKYGWGLVEIFENWQLLTYAAGVYNILEGPAEWTYRLHVGQPRPWHRDGPHRPWTVSGPALGNYIRHLRTAAEEATGASPRLQTGNWCKHCPARRACPALRAEGLSAVDLAREAAATEIPPDQLGVELALLVRARDRLDTLITGRETEAFAALRQGKPVHGWIIEHPPGREAWKISGPEAIALGRAVGVDLAKPADVVTPNQARKAGVPAELLTAFVERKSGAAKLVPLDVNRAKRAFGGQ